MVSLFHFLISFEDSCPCLGCYALYLCRYSSFITITDSTHLSHRCYLISSAVARTPANTHLAQQQRPQMAYQYPAPATPAAGTPAPSAGAGAVASGVHGGVPGGGISSIMKQVMAGAGRYQAAPGQGVVQPVGATIATMQPSTPGQMQVPGAYMGIPAYAPLSHPSTPAAPHTGGAMAAPAPVPAAMGGGVAPHVDLGMGPPPAAAAAMGYAQPPQAFSTVTPAIRQFVMQRAQQMLQNPATEASMRQAISDAMGSDAGIMQLYSHFSQQR